MRALVGSLLVAAHLSGPGLVSAQIAAPSLKWQRGGCFSSWCETGWYSSPAVADLDGDGSAEIIASAYSVVVLDGATGSLEWRVASGHDRNEPGADNVGRTWPGIVVADVDSDGALEIVTAHAEGWVSVYTATGYFKSGWPQQPASNELRGLSLADLDNDHDLEILVTAAVGGKLNAWVLEHDGGIRAGWPQLDDTDSYAYGVFNDTSALADLNGDGAADVLVPSDMHYICGYEADGSHLPADPVFGSKNWGQVGVWEDYTIELRGWGACDGTRAESYRTNFATGPASVADLNGDGMPEIAATGRVYDCTGGETTKYHGLYLFELDRGRFRAPGADWTTVPVDLGLPLSLEYAVIESAMPNPALGDLDGDGELEVVYADFAGQVHAFWLDGSEHGSWPYAVYSSGPYRYASEPALADLDHDGSAEVIFTSWTQKGSNQVGDLFVVSGSGALLHQVALPAAVGSWDWNGSLPCPTLADVDADAELEVVLQTAHSGVVVFNLPGAANTRVHWGTGRGSVFRNGIPNAPEVVFRDGFEWGHNGPWS